MKHPSVRIALQMIEERLIDYLQRKFGGRFLRAYKMLQDKFERVDYLTVTHEKKVEVSGIVEGESMEYPVYVDIENFHCRCTDHTARKVICKHMIILLLYSYKKGKISLGELLALLDR